MAYIPVSSARIPSALSNTIVLSNIQATQREMIVEQGRLSSGKQIPVLAATESQVDAPEGCRLAVDQAYDILSADLDSGQP